ncbi:unnamed protein product [Danaus chrysippus]|uniref:(African queen) hypothetical protein n=1 Tax=Danaus chrysippus TaxID=151541 RepID=A0A8J2WBL3_9NEOP|nr:unnamed protein product [Danaus chrysippus]
MLKSHFNLQQDNEKEAEETPDRKKNEEIELLAEELEHEQLEEDTGKEIIPSFPERILKRSEISIRLSLLGKTAEGDGYTYLKATCTGMGLTDITAVKSFQHLQFLDVSNNNLNLASLQVITELPYLVLIHADKNQLYSAALKTMKYVQVIIMNNNNISTVWDVYQPELSTLEVGYNKIKTIRFEGNMPEIKCLDFRYNLIDDISNLNFPNLDSLYLAGNKIQSLIGIERLTNLRILHLRNNPIKLLYGFEESMKKLQYLNLRNCKVSTLKQIKKLRVLESLTTLVIKGCPFMGGTGTEDAEVGPEEEDPELRIEVLASLPRLKRLNKGVVSPEEKEEAKELMKQWLEEGENDEEEMQEEQNDEDSNAD